MTVIKPADAPEWWSYARAKFTKGNRVRLSEEGHRHHILMNSLAHTGVVVGFSRKGHSVWIKRDGIVARESYHYIFWEPVGEPKAADSVDPVSAGSAEPTTRDKGPTSDSDSAAASGSPATDREP